jgi:hypothetical protein
MGARAIADINMARRLCRVIAVSAALFSVACTGAPLGMQAPVPENVRSAPAESYPDINNVPDRPPRTRSPEEVEEIQRELERLRQSRASGRVGRLTG